MIFEFIPSFEDYPCEFSTQKELSYFFAEPRSIQEIIVYWLKDTNSLSFGRLIDRGEQLLYVAFTNEQLKYGFATTPIINTPSYLPLAELISPCRDSTNLDAIEAWILERNKRLSIREDLFSTHTFAPAQALSELILQYAQCFGGLATVERSKSHVGLGSILLIFSPEAIDVDDSEESDSFLSDEVFYSESDCLGWHESALFSIDELKHFCILDAALPSSYNQ
jgi:hypothetical protein